MIDRGSVGTHLRLDSSDGASTRQVAGRAGVAETQPELIQFRRTLSVFGRVAAIGFDNPRCLPRKHRTLTNGTSQPRLDPIVPFGHELRICYTHQPSLTQRDYLCSAGGRRTPTPEPRPHFEESLRPSVFARADL